jgi:hypothetical protein
MIKNKNIFGIFVLMAVCSAFIGCAKKPASGSQAFATATPEIRQMWEDATAHDQTNDYVVASRGYRGLLSQREKLTAEQAQAVMDASLALNQRMTAAANNGDEAAKAAAQQLMKQAMTR